MKCEDAFHLGEGRTKYVVHVAVDTEHDDMARTEHILLTKQNQDTKYLANHKIVMILIFYSQPT